MKHIREQRRHSRREGVQGLLYEISFYLELAVAALVILLLIGHIIGIAVRMVQTPDFLFDEATFNRFLAMCLNAAVGIEFLKMLCRHSMDAVIEVLLFTLARHLIIEQYSMGESLLCVVAIAILFVVRKFLFVPKADKSWTGTTEETANEFTHSEYEE